jgi:hypothetical protein
MMLNKWQEINGNGQILHPCVAMGDNPWQ